MQGLLVRKQLQQKQKEMLNFVVEQQQKQLHCLELLKLQQLQRKVNLQDLDDSVKEGKEEHVVDLTVDKNPDRELDVIESNVESWDVSEFRHQIVKQKLFHRQFAFKSALTSVFQ